MNPFKSCKKRAPSHRKLGPHLSPHSLDASVPGRAKNEMVIDNHHTYHILQKVGVTAPHERCSIWATMLDHPDRDLDVFPTAIPTHTRRSTICVDGF